MTTKKWMDIEPTMIEIALLQPSQSGLSGNWQEGESYCGDPFVHVVKYMGCYFLSDGHNRLKHALSKGQKSIIARVMEKTITVTNVCPQRFQTEYYF